MLVGSLMGSFRVCCMRAKALLVKMDSIMVGRDACPLWQYDSLRQGHLAVLKLGNRCTTDAAEAGWAPAVKLSADPLPCGQPLARPAAGATHFRKVDRTVGGSVGRGAQGAWGN